MAVPSAAVRFEGTTAPCPTLDLKCRPASNRASGSGSSQQIKEPEANPNAKVGAVRIKNRAALIKSTLLEVASHTAKGVAVGLAFAFILTHITALGIATAINVRHRTTLC